MPARFWERVDRDGPIPAQLPNLGPCWVWTGWRDRDGYGAMDLNGKFRRATHVALELSGITVPKGMMACHHCDNPACVRPSHLFIAPALVNNRDRHVKGRDAIEDKHGRTTKPEQTPRGERNGRAKLTQVEVDAIRVALAGGGATFRGLARQYGVTHRVIRLIHLGLLWPIDYPAPGTARARDILFPEGAA